MLLRSSNVNQHTSRTSRHAVRWQEDVGDLPELGEQSAEAGFVGLVRQVAEVEADGVLGPNKGRVSAAAVLGGAAVLRGVFRLGVNRGIGGGRGGFFGVTHVV